MKQPAHIAGKATPEGLQGWHVLAMMLGFFGIVFAVNGTFLYSAIKTYSGVVSVEPYVKGLQYNERIAAEERQNRLGWTTALAVSPNGEAVLHVTGEKGRAIEHLAIGGEVGRPSTNRLDKRLAFAHAGNGRYVANVGSLGPGAWLVAIEIRSKDFGPEPVYRMRRRIWLKP